MRSRLKRITAAIAIAIATTPMHSSTQSGPGHWDQAIEPTTQGRTHYIAYGSAGKSQIATGCLKDSIHPIRKIRLTHLWPKEEVLQREPWTRQANIELQVDENEPIPSICHFPEEEGEFCEIPELPVQLMTQMQRGNILRFGERLPGEPRRTGEVPLEEAAPHIALIQRECY